MSLYDKVANLISDTVRTARVNSGLSRKEVADGAGVSVQFMHKLENGSAAGLKQVCAVAEYLGLAPEELLTGRPLDENSLDDQILEEVLS